MLSYMILEMTTMKVNLFGKNELLQSAYTLNRANGVIYWYGTNSFLGLPLANIYVIFGLFIRI
jgi:hypothetical protein